MRKSEGNQQSEGIIKKKKNMFVRNTFLNSMLKQRILSPTQCASCVLVRTSASLSQFFHRMDTDCCWMAVSLPQRTLALSSFLAIQANKDAKFQFYRPRNFSLLAQQAAGSCETAPCSKLSEQSCRPHKAILFKFLDTFVGVHVIPFHLHSFGSFKSFLQRLHRG